MRVTVCCGTRLENEEKLAKTARAIGNALAKNHIELVYCGPLAGLMREIVKGVFEKEGAVTGSIHQVPLQKICRQSSLDQAHTPSSIRIRGRNKRNNCWK